MFSFSSTFTIGTGADDSAIEIVNMIGRGQVRWLSKGDIAGHVAFVAGLFGLAAAA